MCFEHNNETPVFEIQYWFIFKLGDAYTFRQGSLITKVGDYDLPGMTLPKLDSRLDPHN